MTPPFVDDRRPHSVFRASGLCLLMGRRPRSPDGGSGRCSTSRDSRRSRAGPRSGGRSTDEAERRAGRDRAARTPPIPARPRPIAVVGAAAVAVSPAIDVDVSVDVPIHIAVDVAIHVPVDVAIGVGASTMRVSAAVEISAVHAMRAAPMHAAASVHPAPAAMHSPAVAVAAAPASPANLNQEAVIALRSAIPVPYASIASACGAAKHTSVAIAIARLTWSQSLHGVPHLYRRRENRRSCGNPVDGP